jgi:ribosomal RNA-processing protein 8
MALFDVPGWSIPNEPVAVTSKKRKRASKQNFDKVQSAVTNVETLMEQLAASPTAVNTRHEGKSGDVSAAGDRPPKEKRRRVKRNKYSQQSPAPAAVQDDETHKASRKKGKKEKRKEKSGEKATVTSSPTETHPPPESCNTSLTSLQHGMKQSLDGARFRYVIYLNFHAGFPTVEHAFQYPVGGSTRSSTSQTVPMHKP